MAGSSKKGSSKGPKSPRSPRSTRSGKAAAAAPETESEGTTKSPKLTRKGAAAAAPETSFNNEDYNIRSLERTKLLAKIKGLFDNAPVSPALWACCQLADMDRLQSIANSDEDLILGYDEILSFIAVKWAQRFRDSDLPELEVTSRAEAPKRRKLNSDEQSLVPQSVKAAENCKERDDYKCALTKIPYPQAAHIFPYSMIHPPAKADKRKASRWIPRFWKLLCLFWNKDQVMKWKHTIFSDPENPNVGAEGCFNLISLTPTAHDMWNKGLFALKPLKLSRDQKKLTVQFFWQVPGNYDSESQIDLLTEPTSSKSLNILPDGCVLHRVNDDGLSPRIQSGETLTFTTKDPKTLPLPSLELLEMQWVLQRLVGMCGAAGWPSLDSYDDDTIDAEDGWFVPDRIDYNVHNSSGRIREWVAEEAAGITPESSRSSCD